MKSYINKRLIWYLIGGLTLLALSGLAMSCSIIEPPDPTPPVAIIHPPTIPHSLDGRYNCRVCHAPGAAGAPQFPADHINRPDDLCMACHEPSTGSVAQPVPYFDINASPFFNIGKDKIAYEPDTLAPHKNHPLAGSNIFATECASCHGSNRQGIPGTGPAITPKDLAGLTSSQIIDIINNGKPGTTMSSFKDILTTEDINALVQFLGEQPLGTSITDLAGTTPRTTGELFASNCSICHGANRQGTAVAPPLNSQTLSDLTTAEVFTTISNGVTDTAMPTFKIYLTTDEINGLAQFVMSPAGSQPPPATTPPSNASASDLFASNCAACHGTNRQGTPGLAPALNSQTLADMSNADIVSTITSGRPGTAMPSFQGKLTASQISALAQFVAAPAGAQPSPTTTPPPATTPTTSPSALSGTQIFAANCAVCHGANRQGTPGLAPALNAQTLASMSDAEIASTITNGRTGTAMPSFGSRLSADQINALVQFVKSP